MFGRLLKMKYRYSTRGSAIALAMGVCAITISCGQKANPAAMQLPPPNVSVVEVQPTNISIYSDYTAQTFARDLVEVRGRVDGYIENRLFKVGSDVATGEVLYTLDRRPYQADVAKAKSDVEQAQANLEYAKKQVGLIQAQADFAQAKANLAKAKQDVTRLEPLVKQEAAPQQDLDNARSAYDASLANVDAKQANVDQNRLSTRSQIDTAAAQLAANQALLRTAELNLEYATINAPIGGRIGDSLIPVGGLVSKTSANPLTTIVPLDPIWVRYKVSEGRYLTDIHNKGKKEMVAIPLELVLADNTIHPFPGRLQNTVNQVDAKTGTLELQATFPNPQHTLLPGQFGRVRFRSDEQRSALTVPQRAVQDLQGIQSVLTIGPNNVVQARTIVTGERVGDQWIVKQGLKPGDKVIVEGQMKARPGTPVSPQLVKQPAAIQKGA
jgi:membrane fusion protein (multidrug efflux system)